ncbi:MAG: hypothetical protein IPH50_07520 [Rhodanobacteraceae bacterium]|nr:hypothetical protein [Rhodanobacteraceae bacterium]
MHFLLGAFVESTGRCIRVKLVEQNLAATAAVDTSHRDIWRAAFECALQTGFPTKRGIGEHAGALPDIQHESMHMPVRCPAQTVIIDILLLHVPPAPQHAVSVDIADQQTVEIGVGGEVAQ